MAYVVSATWTAQPGRRTSSSTRSRSSPRPPGEEPGNRFYQAYQDPAEPGIFRLFEIYDDEEAYAAHGASDALQGSTRSSRPSRCWPTASARSSRRSADAREARRLPPYRRARRDPPRRTRRRRRVRAGGSTRSPTAPTWSSCSPPTPRTREARGRRGGPERRAAARARSCCCRRSTRSRCATSSPSRRTSTAWSAGRATPGPPAEWYDAPVVPVHGAARRDRPLRRGGDAARTPSGSTSSSRSPRSSAATSAT